MLWMAHLFLCFVSFVAQPINSCTESSLSISEFGFFLEAQHGSRLLLSLSFDIQAICCLCGGGGEGGCLLHFFPCIFLFPQPFPPHQPAAIRQQMTPFYSPSLTSSPMVEYNARQAWCKSVASGTSHGFVWCRLVLCTAQQWNSRNHYCGVFFPPSNGFMM